MSRQPAWRTSHAGLPRARPRATDHTTDTRQTLVNPAEVQPSHSLSSSVLRPTPPQQHLCAVVSAVLYCAAQALAPEGPPPAEGGGRGANMGALRPRLGTGRPAAFASSSAFTRAASSASLAAFLAASSASSSAKRAAVASAAPLSSSDVAELPLLCRKLGSPSCSASHAADVVAWACGGLLSATGVVTTTAGVWTAGCGSCAVGACAVGASILRAVNLNRSSRARWVRSSCQFVW